MNKVCYGCGIKLQSTDPSIEGYIPFEKMEHCNYCKRCFRLIHYGEAPKSDRPKSTREIINAVNKHAKFVVFMVDFVNIYDSIMDIYANVEVPKVLVVSKADIIPKNISFDTIKMYLRDVYKVKEEIIFTSNLSTNALIKELYNKSEVYFMGLTNVGKSSLINAMLAKMNAKATPLTTSHTMNTTLEFLRVKVGKQVFIDSPGFVDLAYEGDNKTKIDREIKPITYQNKDRRTYKIGDVFTISIMGGTNVVFYFSNNLKLDRFYKKEVHGKKIKIAGREDLVISGLGFIKFTSEAWVEVSSEVAEYTHIRTSLVGGTR